MRSFSRLEALERSAKHLQKALHRKSFDANRYYSTLIETVEAFLNHPDFATECPELAKETDLPLALKELKFRFEESSKDPLWKVPGDFMPDKEDPEERFFLWRRVTTPWLNTALCWVLEIFRRVEDGRPPQTLKEFRELADWMRKNQDRFTEMERQPGAPRVAAEFGKPEWKAYELVYHCSIASCHYTDPKHNELFYLMQRIKAVYEERFRDQAVER